MTSGTRGDVRLQSFVIRQWIEVSEWHRWTVGATVGYRRSTMDWLRRARANPRLA